MYTWGLAGCRYPFSYPKYERQYVPATSIWQIADTSFSTQNIKRSVYLRPVIAGICFLIQNMKRGVYLWLVPIYLTKIWGVEAKPVIST